MTCATTIHALSRFLRLDVAQAADAAARVDAAQDHLKRLLRQRASRRRKIPDPHLPLPPQGPLVVAMAFSQSSLLWLQQLSFTARHPLRILRTELSEPYFRAHGREHGRLTLLSPLQMIRQGVEADSATIFVTFPDHTVGHGNTNVQVPFFGEPMLFQTLESLLVRKHAAGLYRWVGGCLERRERTGPCADLESALVAEAAWLADGIERTIVADPGQYFGWGRIARKCPRRMQHLHRMRLDVLTGFLRSWAWQAEPCAQTLSELLALIDRDGPRLLEAETNAGLRLAAG